MSASDFIETQLALYKGASPLQKAKAHVLQLLQQVEAAHAKIAKLAASKEDLDAFLEKCIHAQTKPKLLRDIGEIAVKVEDTRGALLEAKVAEEKREERKAKREAKKAVASSTTNAAIMTSLGGITVNVHVGGGGTTSTTLGLPMADESKKKKKPIKMAVAPKGDYKKKGIPKNVRNQTWNHYIGKALGEAPCYCCGINKIDKAAFEAGHVLPEVHGGPSTIENLRPICGECNRSMRDMDMREYAMRYYGRVV